MYENFTDRSRKVLAIANQEAQRFNHEYIGTEHLLLGLVKEGSGVGSNVLRNLGIDLHKVRLEVEKLVKSGPDMVTMGKLPHTPRTKKVIEYAVEEARDLSHNYVGTEHLLLGLVKEHDGVAAQVLMNLGVKLEDVRKEVLNLLGAAVQQEATLDPFLSNKGTATVIVKDDQKVEHKDSFTYDAFMVFVYNDEDVEATLKAVTSGPTAAFSYIATISQLATRCLYCVSPGVIQSNGVLMPVGTRIDGDDAALYTMTDEQLYLKFQ